MKRWPTKPLLALASLTRGTEPGSGSYTDSTKGRRFLRVGDITGKTDNPVYTNASKLVLVTETDLLFALDGTPGHVSTGHSGAISSGIRKVEVLAKADLTMGWLRYALSSHAVQATIKQHTRGVTILHASSALPHIQIPVPPFAEQQRIVKLLDGADILKKARFEADRLIATLLPALFEEMFGEVIARQEGWPVSPLGELIISGPQNGLYKHSSYYGGGTPILRIDAFYGGEVQDLTSLKRLHTTPEELHRYSLRKNDIVINRVNSPEYLGKSTLIPALPEPTVFESNMMRFSVAADVVDASYLIRFLQTPGAKRHILSRAKHSINQSSINQEDVKCLPVLIPPLRLQKEFAQRVIEIRELEARQAASRTRLDALFQSMLHRAFNGDL